MFVERIRLFGTELTNIAETQSASTGNEGVNLLGHAATSTEQYQWLYAEGRCLSKFAQ